MSTLALYHRDRRGAEWSATGALADSAAALLANVSVLGPGEYRTGPADDAPDPDERAEVVVKRPRKIRFGRPAKRRGREIRP